MQTFPIILSKSVFYMLCVWLHNVDFTSSLTDLHTHLDALAINPSTPIPHPYGTTLEHQLGGIGTDFQTPIQPNVSPQRATRHSCIAKGVGLMPKSQDDNFYNLFLLLLLLFFVKTLLIYGPCKTPPPLLPHLFINSWKGPTTLGTFQRRNETWNQLCVCPKCLKCSLNTEMIIFKFLGNFLKP